MMQGVVSKNTSRTNTTHEHPYDTSANHFVVNGAHVRAINEFCCGAVREFAESRLLVMLVLASVGNDTTQLQDNQQL